MTEVEIKCKDCGRYLGSTSKSVSITLKCSNSSCKKLNNYSITFLSDLIDKYMEKEEYGRQEE